MKKKKTKKTLLYLQHLSFDDVRGRGREFELEGQKYIEFHMDDIRDLPFMDKVSNLPGQVENLVGTNPTSAVIKSANP